MTLSTEQVLKARSNAADQLDEIEAAVALDRNRLKSSIAKLDEWLWNNVEHNAEDIVAEFVALRDKRAELKAAYEAEDALLKEQMNKRDSWLLHKCNTEKLESIRTAHGTAYTQTKTRFNVADWINYWDWLIENRRLDLLEKRPSQGALAKMVEAGEDLPPGLNQFVEKTITVRRA